MRLSSSSFRLPTSPSAPNRLFELPPVRPNPGNLRGFGYVPENLAPGAPLVVVLHGCTQTAAAYDHGAGWSKLADRHGFALLLPEQQRENNALLCFNWFAVGDSQRGMGEPASIHSMVQVMRNAHSIDPGRVFVTGLSAGGAMASVLLATYPDVFAAGAIIAGVPFGCASDMRQAFDCMGGRGREEAGELAAKVRRASPHKGPWPRVSVWQGSADNTVVPSNADAIVLQWTQLHGLGPEPDRIERIDGYPRSVWLNGENQTVVERYDITGMAHGTPLMPGDGDGRSGEAGAHMLDADISSTDRIAAFFGIAPEPPGRQTDEPGWRKRPPSTRPTAAAGIPAGIRQVIDDALRAGPGLPVDVKKVIDDALQTAGLGHGTLLRNGESSP